MVQGDPSLDEGVGTVALRRVAICLMVAAVGLAGCGGDDSDDASVTVEEPIGAPEAGSDHALEAGPSVSKSARIEMEVGRPDVAEAAQSVVDLATSDAVGGFLASSVVDLEDGYGSAVVLVEVPVTRFEKAVSSLGGIGRVTRQEMAGEPLDTSTRAARKDAAEQAEYSPIDVAISGKRPPPPPERSPIDRALGTAEDISLTVISGAIVAAGVVVPVGAILGTIWFVCSLVLRRLRLRWES